MRAAVFHGAGRPLEVTDVTTPIPGPGEALVRVAACGVCHTDLHYLDHGTPTFKPPPLVLGHEIAGTVASLGSGVEGLTAGDSVLAAAVLPCGLCPNCRDGRENICERSRMLGNNLDGGFAEYVVVPGKDLFQVPAELPLAESAVIADAVTTPYHAVVRRGRVTAGDWVVVFGCGGVGLNVVQLAAAVGGRVIAVDQVDGKLEWARRLGAEATFNPSRVGRLDRELRRVTGAGADVAFEVIGKAATQEQAFASVRAGGRVVLVGYSGDPLPLNAARLMYREIEVIGSLGCRPVDYPRVIELARLGRIRVGDLVTHRFPLAAINEAFDALRGGDVIRAIVIP